jgi:hypothetical protein
MSLDVVLKSETKTQATLELVRDGGDINIEVDGILLGYFDSEGILQIAYPSRKELDTLEDLGFALNESETSIALEL